MSSRKQYQHDWHLRNREKRNDQINSRKQGLIEWVNDYKRNHSCQHCKETDIVCLDFHHVDGRGKDGQWVAVMARQGYALNLIETEVAKCIVLCANCHRKLHANQDQ